MGSILFCFVLAVSFWCTSLIMDRQQLNSQLIRFHVVANSDSQADQNMKLQVRDAVLQSIRTDLRNLTDTTQAKIYLEENLPRIQAIANAVLHEAGFEQKTLVTLGRETFDKRVYDTFTLPAGVYPSLRITIGEGAGQNWWCVTFPSLCIPATSEEFQQVAVTSGFSDSLTGALVGERSYEIRFYLLDLMGRLENIFYSGE